VTRLGVRWRVGAVLALALAVVLAAAGLAVREGLARSLQDGFDEALETRAAAVARLLVERGGPVPGLTRGLDDPGESFTQVIAPGERVVTGTPGLPGDPLLGPALRRRAPEGLDVVLRGIELSSAEDAGEIDVDALEDADPEPFETDRARVVVRRVAVGGTTYEVLVGATREEEEEALAALSRVLVVALPVVLAVTLVASMLALGAALRPMERMRERAARLSERDLHERLPVPPADDEVGRLGRTLNELLDRLERALGRERAFAADAGHELRTPLAILIAELDLARRGDRPPEELRRAMTAALAEAERLAAITEDLLLLARADADRLALRPEPVPAVALLQATRDRFAARAQLAVDAAPDLLVLADEARVLQALGGLVENALRHGSPPVELRARATADGSRVELVVADRGPGVDPAFAARAFERFARADAARSTPGTGLGLAIVLAIAEAHGGSAALRPRADGGTEALIELSSAGV
jgi:two-component system, OmpR family, sensor kinase